jgi:hypothetical protein
MTEIRFKFAGQKYVGIATRKPDGTLDHECFRLVDSFPNQGIFSPRGKFLEVLTEKELLDERSRAALDPIEAVLVVEPETNHFLPCHFHAVRTALHRKERNQGRLLRSMLLKLRFQADSSPT